MEILNNLFLNLMHISFPILIYLVYVCYKKSYNQKENDLAIIVTIFSVLYIMFKFNDPLFADIPIMLVNLTLIMAFFKKSDIGILISSIIGISYYYIFYNNYLIIFILLYISYYFLYLKLNHIYKTNILITIIHTLLIIILTFINIKNHYFVYFYEIIFISFVNYLVITLIIYIMLKAEKILKLYMTSKELEHEKQIKNSLFKITHEIKNPIAVCKGYLDMFDIDNKNHAKKYIPVMKEEINRTLYLLEDFLAMNKIKIKKELVDINLLLEDISDHFKLMFKEKNIVFESKINDDELYINGDYNRLTQVFLNILKNSIEAIQNNGEIILSEEIKNKKIYISIKDNGSGITKQDLKHIKEAFYTTKIKGTGLGVSLSNEIVEAHGGQLNYESKIGEYTLVTIILPLEEI